MQVKHRLLLNLVVAALLVAAILVMLVTTTRRVVTTVETSTIADAIITTAFERLALDSDYINSGNERVRRQVDAKYRQIGDLLKSATEKFTAPEDQKTLTALIETSESVRAILLSIMANREHVNPTDRPEALSLEVDERLRSQMTMRIYETVRLGGNLKEASNAAIILSLKQAGAGIVAILFFVGVVTVINFVTLNRAISRRMERLRHGAALIGEGRLDHRIEIGGSDEFADLAKAFNAMTEKLSGSYQELEKEVEVRRRAEEAVINDITGRIRAEENLQKAYSELETRVTARTQELQDLTETLEDRVAKRTAELRAANETLRTSRLAALNLMEDAVIDRKNLEEITASLRDSEEKYRNLFVNMTEEVHLWEVVRDDVGGIKTWRLVDANPPTIKSWNRKSVEEIRGKTTDEIFGPGATEHYMPVVRNIFTEGVPYTFEDYFPHLDKHFRFTSVPFGEYFITTGADITDIKKAELALRESEERLNRTQEIAHLGGWEFDLAGNRLFCSDEVYRIFGFQPQEIEATREAFLERLHPDDRNAMDVYADSIREGRDGYEVEMRIMRESDDQVRVVLEKCEHFRDASGRIIRSVGMVHDITESKEAEESLRRANADLTNLNKELESFVYSASHDLRAPLRHISAFAELVIGRYAGRLDQKGRDYLLRISSSAARMTKTIDELLKLSRISRQDIRWETVDLSEMAAHIVGGLREADPGRQVEVAIEPGLVAHGDPGLLELSLSNMLRNAWKFTSKTENPQIAFGTVLQNEKRVYSVRDNGAGFDMKIAAKMFLPFHRLHPDSHFEGNGIGLAIVERAIRRHGGRVWAEGEVGRGATLYFRLED